MSFSIEVEKVNIHELQSFVVIKVIVQFASIIYFINIDKYSKSPDCVTIQYIYKIYINIRVYCCY